MCQSLAESAQKSGTFKAWLSDGMNGPSTRFMINPAFSGPFELVNGTVVAEGWGDLTDGSLLHPINVDEKGAEVESSAVWTNTAGDGSPAGTTHCSEWTSNMFNVSGWIGGSSEMAEAWTNGQGNSCSSSARIYCLQVE